MPASPLASSKKRRKSALRARVEIHRRQARWRSGSVASETRRKTMWTGPIRRIGLPLETDPTAGGRGWYR